MGAGNERGSARAASHGAMHSPVNWGLLGLIIERPSYAYELARRFERTYEGALSLSSVSHIYTALASLRERDLIEEVPSAESKRSRRRYQATASGLLEHSSWLVDQAHEERRRQQVLISQLGALAREPARAIEILDAYEQACLAEATSAPAIGADEGPGTTRLVARLVGEETRLAVAAKLRWVQYARAQLLALPDPEPGVMRRASR